MPKSAAARCWGAAAPLSCDGGVSEAAARAMPAPFEDAVQFDALVSECAAAGIARDMLWLRRSDLPAALAEPQHLRLAADALAPLAGADRVRMFALPNQDLVAVWRGAAEPMVARCIVALRHMFADVPELLLDPQTLLRRFTLPRDAALVRLSIAASLPALAGAPVAVDAGLPLTLAALTSLERNLAYADVSRFARRRQVFMRSGDAFQMRWEVRLLSLREIGATLAPDVLMQADPWLLRRLQRCLDRRLLAMLAAQGELQQAGPFGINLSVSSILAPEFLRFDAALPPRLRGLAVIGVALADVIADLPSFTFARDFAAARKYLLLLRDVTPASLALVDAEALSFDLVHLRWSPAWQATPNALAGNNVARLLLGQANSLEAVSWGAAHGITLFQGTVMQPAQRRSDPFAAGLRLAG